MSVLRQWLGLSPALTACSLHTRRANAEVCGRSVLDAMLFHLMQLSSGLFRHVVGIDFVSIGKPGVSPRSLLIVPYLMIDMLQRRISNFEW